MSNDIAVQAPQREPNRIEVFLDSRGVQMALSEKQKIVVETWLATHNFALVVKAVNDKFKTKHTRAAIRAWMAYPNVRDHIVERERRRAIAAGYGPEDWKVDGVLALKGHAPLDEGQRDMWKTLGKHMGMFDDRSQSQNNIQINILQKDGTP